MKKKKSEKVDRRLTELSPALKKRLQEIPTQIGDLQSLGLRVLERARAISEKMKDQISSSAQGVVKTAMGKGSTVTKKSRAKRKPATKAPRRAKTSVSKKGSKKK